MTCQAAFVYDDALSGHILRSDHPLKSERLRHTYELLDAYGAFDIEGSLLVKPRPATREEILTIHSATYVDAVKNFSDGKLISDPSEFNFHAGGDNPIFQGMYETAALSTGASLVAAALVSSGQAPVAFSISGGLHHAARDYASGFCVFNDPSIAIKYLVDRGLRVVYVDIDAHHGDGVQDIYYDNERVMTISLHESGTFLFPGTGRSEDIGSGAAAGYSVNLPLHPFTDDVTYLWAFREIVPPLVQSFKPDVLVTQLGIDSYFNDPLTHLMLTSWGYTETVMEFARLGLPWLALGGGGYDLSAVARCWSIAYGIMLGQEWPNDIPLRYQEKYGIQLLRDSGGPTLDDEIRTKTKQFAERNIQLIKTLVFPIHGLE